MKPYIVSLLAGILVGAVYGMLNVRSPAPPVVALVGLLGILVGEQLVPLGKQLVAGAPIAAYLRSHCKDHVLGALPGDKSRSMPQVASSSPPSPPSSL